MRISGRSEGLAICFRRGNRAVFRKTLLRLTLLYAGLLILLISTFGSLIYGYEKQRTFHESDRMLVRSVNDKVHSIVNRTPIPFDMPNFGQPRGPRTMLYWVIYDAKGKRLLSSLDRNGQVTAKEIDQWFQLLKVKGTNRIIDKTIGTASYHILTKKAESGGKVYRVSAIIDITTEMRMLHELFLIILIGIAAGTLVCALVGYFLAKLALRPIEKAWEKQNRFVADASHELRTPLSILQLKIEGMLRQPKQRIQDAGEDIAVMLEETRRLSKLVANLLTLARSDANRLEVLLAPLDLKELVRKVTEPFAEMAEFEEKTFLLEMDDQPLLISADAQRIHQLLVILLDNAMKFTPANGTIRVSCHRELKYACLSVADTGQGIAPADLPHIFERFYQADVSRSAGKGTGLGLSIAQWIVSRHRGKIDASSGPDQQGTSFVVRLPLLKNDALPVRDESGE